MSRSAPTDIDIGRFYTPQPVQRKFHASEARYPLLEGGRGGGKSTALLWEAISQCLHVPGANCLLLRRTLTAMEKGGIEDLFKKQVPRSLYRRYNATKHVITFCNGSNLFFGHVKTDADLLQYQCAEFLFIGWEELTQFTYSQWDFLKGSNRCPIKTYEHKGRCTPRGRVWPVALTPMEKAAAGSKRCGSRRSLLARWPRSTIRQSTKRFTRPTKTTSYIAMTRTISRR